MERLRLAIIVLNYKTPGLVADCLATLSGQVEAGLDEVVVVDNASGDGSAEAIRRGIDGAGYGSWARVVESPTNGGFASGNNVGIESSDAELYLLLNSDTLVDEGSIAALLAAADSHPRAGLIGPRLVSREGEAQTGAFREPTPMTQLATSARTGAITKAWPRLEVASAPGSDIPDADRAWVSFAAVLIRREVIDAIGMLDDGYFMYFEDVDFCLRAGRAGFGFAVCDGARVVHLEGESSGVAGLAGARRALPAYYWAARSRFFAKNYGWLGLLAANAWWTLGVAIHDARWLVRERPRSLPRRCLRDAWGRVVSPLAVWRPGVGA